MKGNKILDQFRKPKAIAQKVKRPFVPPKPAVGGQILAVARLKALQIQIGTSSVKDNFGPVHVIVCSIVTCFVVAFC